VAEARVHGAGVHQIGQPQLLDAPLALEVRMFDDLQYHRVFDREEPVIHGVVDNLPLISHKKDFSILLNLLTENDVFYCLSSRKKRQRSTKPRFTLAHQLLTQHYTLISHHIGVLQKTPRRVETINPPYEKPV
jgi:hypothetical protein